MSLREKMEIPDILSSIYKDMEVSPLGILKNYAINLIHGKLNKYEAESRHFQKKYNCAYSEFKVRIETMVERENFEWDDDFLDWKFAVENFLYWKEKLQELSSL